MKREIELSKLIIGLCSFYYLWILIRIIIFKNGLDVNICRVNLQLFNLSSQFTLTKTYLINFLGNIFLFIPLSIILKYYFNWLRNSNVIYLGFSISLSLELIQYATRIGVFDINDILLNTIGTIIGTIIYHYLNKENTSIFLLSFGIISLIITYHLYPNLITTFI